MSTARQFSDDFDVMLFHYDGRTTEWDDEFPWSKEAIHVSARKQAKWWYAKRFLHPSVVAPYEYLFLWDEDLSPPTSSTPTSTCASPPSTACASRSRGWTSPGGRRRTTSPPGGTVARSTAAPWGAPATAPTCTSAPAAASWR